MTSATFAVETTPGKLHHAADTIDALENAQVHNKEGFRLVVSVACHDSSALLDTIRVITQVAGVVEISLVFAVDGDRPVSAAVQEAIVQACQMPD